MFVVIRAAMEDFIEKVKEHPCLWDVNSVLYRDISKKEALWEVIARDCGMDGGKTAKLLWKRLRDSHREALRRRRNQGAINRPWKYEELMEFILPHFGNREPNENEDEHAQTSDAIDEPEISITVPKTTVIPRFVKQKAATLKLFEERAKRRRREMERGPGPKKVITARQNCSQPTDALTELFSSMCKKTKQLPKHLQLRVQREVFDSVTRAEEEVLCYNQDHDKTSTSVSVCPPLFMFKTSPRSEPESESAAASRDDDMFSDN